MNRTVVFLLLAACSATPPPTSSSTTGDTTDDVTSDASTSTSTAGTSDESTDASSTTTSETSETTTPDPTSTSTVTTEPAAECGDGVLDPGEQCDDGQETKLCDDDCSPVACGDAHANAAAGEACDDGNVDNTDACLEDCSAASCGDGLLWAGAEECDDGNTEPGDGCDETCARERWSHVGVAHDVPVDDLHRWEPCWTDTYEAGDAVTAPIDACAGDHLLVACRPAGASTLTLAAHGPREVVLKDVDYPAGERSLVNGVAFYWSPYHAVVGFGPPDGAWCYDGEGAIGAGNLCWRADQQQFLSGYRCGDAWASLAPSAAWERVIFQSWD